MMPQIGEVVGFEGTGEITKIQKWSNIGIWVDVTFKLPKGEERTISIPIECIKRFEPTELFVAPDGSC